jgi:O-antigen ligase
MQRSHPFSLLALFGIAFAAVIIGFLTGIGGGIVAAGLMIVIAGGLALVRDFRVGVMALMLMMPIAATTIMPRQMFGITGMNPFNIVLAATLASLLVAFLFGQVRLMPVPQKIFGPLVFLLALGTYIGASKVKMIAPHFYIDTPTLYHTATEYARDEFIKPMLMFLTVWLIALAVSVSKQPERWLTLFGWSVIWLPLLVAAAVLHSGMSLHELASPQARTALSVTGLHANAFSVILLPAFASALFMLPTRKTFVGKVFGLVVVGATLAALLLTFSRAAFLGMLLVTAIFFFLRGQFRYIFFGCLFFAVVAVSLPGAFIERATQGMGDGNRVGGHNDSLTAGRVGGIWTPLVPEILKHPLLGDGVGSTLWSAPARQGVFMEGHPHNAYLRLLMDHGLLGVPVIAYFLLQIWRLFQRLSQDQRLSPTGRAFFQGTRMAYMVFFVQCMSGSILLFDMQQVFYWFAIAIGVGLERYLDTRAPAASAVARTAPAVR